MALAMPYPIPYPMPYPYALPDDAYAPAPAYYAPAYHAPTYFAPAYQAPAVSVSKNSGEEANIIAKLIENVMQEVVGDGR